MQTTVFTLMFMASAPIFLVPTFIAFFSRRGHVLKVGPVNLFLWILLYFTVRAAVSDSPSLSDYAEPRTMLAFQPFVAVLLIGWLALLRYVIAGGAKHTNAGTAPSTAQGLATGRPGHASSNTSLERTREG